MTDITTTIASDINRLHDLASQRATEAIDYAKQAGLLLLQVKGSLKHGEFLPWLEQNITVSARQARRYMQVAEGRPLPIRADEAKRSHVSTSAERRSGQTANLERASAVTRCYGPPEADAPRNLPGQPEPSGFVPELGHCYASLQLDGTLYVVEPSGKWPGFFFVTRLYQDGETYDCTRRPVRADFVTENLAYYGLADAASAAWKVKPSAGVLEAMGSFVEVTA